MQKENAADMAENLTCFSLLHKAGLDSWGQTPEYKNKFRNLVEILPDGSQRAAQFLPPDHNSAGYGICRGQAC